jgi:metal-responsive CopG/Arc/MetJ family transcriptional regulator
MTMTQFTIDLPDQLAEKLNTYLQNHPEETLVGLIHEALKIKMLPKDSAKLLELAGIVTDAPRGAAGHAEDFED